MREAMEQPVVQARGFVTEVDHPTIGPTRLAASPLIFPGSFKRGGYSPAPLLGQHTREVLSNLAGLDNAGIDRLLDRHVLEEPADGKDTPANARRKILP
jgi:CoA:oxalate CoA-transferase